MKLKLNNNQIFEIKETTTPYIIKADFYSIEDINALTMALTKGNLSHFELLSDDDILMGSYDNYALVKTSYTISDNGVYIAEFKVRQMSDEEVRLDALEAEQELQNGAIDELANIVGGE